MNRHAYLRAYMAGIALPTAFLLVALTAFCVARFILRIPVPIERAIVFPMALIPNLWGVWNILYFAWRNKHRWDIGLHGAILPVILVPMGFFAATLLGFLETTGRGFAYFDTVRVPFARIGIIFPVAIAIYYLAWKYVVGFLNSVVEIGDKP
jgi:hypothetical protein